MDFWTYPTLYASRRDTLPPELRDLDTFHANAMADMAAQGDPIGPKQVDAEHKWLKDARPYYHVYPGILDPLLNLALDLDTGAIRPPRRALAICLPKDHRHPRLTFADGQVQSILMAKGEARFGQVCYDAINMFIDVGRNPSGNTIKMRVFTGPTERTDNDDNESYASTREVAPQGVPQRPGN